MMPRCEVLWAASRNGRSHHLGTIFLFAVSQSGMQCEGVSGVRAGFLDFLLAALLHGEVPAAAGGADEDERCGGRRGGGGRGRAACSTAATDAAGAVPARGVRRARLLHRCSRRWG